MAPYIIPTLPTSTILNITWQQRSREWVDNFTVVLAEDFEVPMKTYEVKCVHSEPSCIAKEFVEVNNHIFITLPGILFIY